MGLSDLALTITIGLASWSDWRQRKIYNKLLFPAFAIALVLNLWNHGTDGLIDALLGAGLGLILLLIPFFMGGIGAGDVKLLGVIGAFGGVHFVIQVFFYGAVIGGIVSAVLLARQGMLIQTIVKFFLTLPFWSKPKDFHDSVSSYGQEVFPYGIALALGTIVVMFLV